MGGAQFHMQHGDAQVHSAEAEVPAGLDDADSPALRLKPPGLPVYRARGQPGAGEGALLPFRQGLQGFLVQASQGFQAFAGAAHIGFPGHAHGGDGHDAFPRLQGQ